MKDYQASPVKTVKTRWVQSNKQHFQKQKKKYYNQFHKAAISLTDRVSQKGNQMLRMMDAL